MGNKAGHLGGRRAPPLDESKEVELDAVVKIPFFGNLENERLKLIQDLFARRSCKKGEIVLDASSDRENQCFFIIVNGSVDVYVGDGDNQKIIQTLDMGEWFGHTALIGEEIVPTSVRAREDSVILSLSEEKYSDFSDKYGLSVSVSELQTKAGVVPKELTLKKTALFCELPEAKLQILSGLFLMKRFPPGHIICHQGDSPDGFYILVDGRVEVSANVNNDKELVHLDTLTRGDWFVETALINNMHRTADVKTLCDTVCLFLKREDFDRVRKVVPELLTTDYFAKVTRKRTANALKALPLFSVHARKQTRALQRFDDQTMVLLGELFSVKEFAPGDVIFEQGETADALYFIASGKVSIVFRDPVGEQQELGQVCENELFGELSMFETSKRIATATAVTQLR